MGVGQRGRGDWKSQRESLSCGGNQWFRNMKRLFVLLTAALTVLTVSCKKDQHNTDETTADTTIKVPVPEAVDLGLSDRSIGTYL